MAVATTPKAWTPNQRRAQLKRLEARKARLKAQLDQTTAEIREHKEALAAAKQAAAANGAH